MIKKILLFSCLIIFIPVIIVSIFIRNEEITFNFTENSVVRVYRENTGKIENVPIEEYVVGVVAGEMPVEFEYEALKAQIIASRTYLETKGKCDKFETADICTDSTHCQSFISEEDLKLKWGTNYKKYISKIKKAVNETNKLMI